LSFLSWIPRISPDLLPENCGVGIIVCFNMLTQYNKKTTALPEFFTFSIFFGYWGFSGETAEIC
jgi:hypothetical protein